MAFFELNHTLHRYRHVSQQVYDDFLRILPQKYTENDHGIGVQIEKLDSGGEMARTFYRFRNTKGHDLFLKQVSQESSNLFYATELLVRSVYENGFSSVIPMLDGFPVHLSEEYAIFGYPFVEACFVSIAEKDMYALGRSVALLHEVLRSDGFIRSYPAYTQIKNASNQDCFSIVRFIEALQRGDGDFNGLPRVVRDFLQNNKQKFTLLSNILLRYIESSLVQVIHNDLHYHNVLQKPGGKIILLDFEESLCSFFVPVMDVATLIERFILVNNYDERMTISLGRALLTGYLSISPTTYLDDVDMSSLLQIRVLRAMSRLASSKNMYCLQSTGARSIFYKEWEKFIHLFMQADKSKAILHHIIRQVLT